MSRKTQLLRCTAVATTLCLAARAAFAADQPPPEEPSATKGPLQEIVVTAERRSEDISKVPMSITALTGDQMDKAGISNISDIAKIVPGLNFQEAGDSFGDTQIALRGIVSKTGYAPTAVYIDDTPIQTRFYAFAGTTNPYPLVFDLDHVEVLKGPQGTLFGASSEGGNVRFITPQASLTEYSGFAKADVDYTVNGDPSWELGAAAGGPIIPDVLGFRISAWQRIDGGYVDRIDAATGDVVDPNSNWSQSRVLRVAFAYKPIDGLTITPSFFYQDVYTHDTDLYYETAGRFRNSSQVDQPDDDHFDLPALGVAYDFGLFSVKSTTSYFHRTDDKVSDTAPFDLSEFVPYAGTYHGGIVLPNGYPFISRAFFVNGQENYNEDLQFVSNDQPGDRLTWVFGLYYAHDRQSLDYKIVEPLQNVINSGVLINNPSYYCTPGMSVAECFGVGMLGQYSYVQTQLWHDTDESAYANVSYNITDEIKAQVGLRGSHSIFDFSDYFNGPYNSHLLPNGTYTGVSNNSATKKEWPVTPRFSISDQLDPDQMVYATVAEGYRDGGGNDNLANLTSCAQDFQNLGIKGNPLTYNSDTVWSYEVGDKAKLFDHSLALEGAVFWIKWSNIQNLIYLPICGYDYTQNLGEAVSQGFELSAQWIVGHGLTLSGNVAFTDARYTKTVPSGGTSAKDLASAGDSLGTPEWTSTLSADYERDLSTTWTGYLRGSFEFQGPYDRGPGANTVSYDPTVRYGAPTYTVGMRVGVTDGNWDISMHGDNLLNQQTSLFRYHDTPISPGYRDETLRPLTIGLTAEYHF